MATNHVTHFCDASNMHQLGDCEINLVVTSPPYPMVEMWDEIFAKSDPEITKLIADGDGWSAFERMHQIMDNIWAECYRVTDSGGFVCINIGDATRTIGGEFALYTNRSRIDTKMIELGFTPLPSIIWQKVSNSPTAFLGSGMLPAGAYVAHGHEHILIYRKGGKRQFKSNEEKQLRRESAYFWEERNVWFSDVWKFTGTKQKLGKSVDRERSAAYPFELPFRLIAMYSVKGDTILDPFMGTGSTHAAAKALARNSLGYEIDPTLEMTIEETLSKADEWGDLRKRKRLADHKEFVKKREESGKNIKHFNENHQTKVITSQETGIQILGIYDDEGFLDYGNMDDEQRKVFQKMIADAVNLPDCFQIIDGREKFNHKYEFLFNPANSRGPSITRRALVDSPPDILREYKPKTYMDFEKIYFEVAKNGKGERITEDTFGELGILLQKKLEKQFKDMELPMPPIPIQCYEAWARNMTLGKTWDGIMLGEKNIADWLEKELEIEVIDPPKGMDADLGVDLIIRVGVLLIGIQVKPTDYFEDKDREKELKKKHSKFEKEHGGGVGFAYYNKETMSPLTKSGKKEISKNKGLLDWLRNEIDKLKRRQEKK